MGVSVDYSFYEQEYGGTLDVEAFHVAMPGALRAVRSVTAGADPSDDSEATCWKRAVCAALEIISEYGEGQVGGFQIGDFRAVEYGEAASCGAVLAREAALAELAGTGLAFSGVR